MLNATKTDIDQHNGTVVATVHTRELTGPAMQELVDDLLMRMRMDNASYFVLGMAAVEHMDSGCIGTLVAFLQDVQHVRGRVALAACRPNVQFLFKVTRLDSVFHLYDDVAKACEEITRR